MPDQVTWPVIAPVTAAARGTSAAHSKETTNQTAATVRAGRRMGNISRG